ncbi:arginyl-tRNA--protein transferase 1 [Chrysoperla carnea]|uniref:arginyl-tRNA--protein transferase 1 n=1 Tax=Chrysoperla carnea TaxID=189513 RepID=UPI001D071CAA|nr:arginyl-tRNA--protein transferase 1 [Chrysoperla carnea]
MDGNFSLVHYVSEQEKHKCGYCKKLKSSATYGMWAQYLTVQDYQELIDRGWRRSGKYCYKPIMDVTCCPMYTIRCEALNLKLSKSQKKILKRVNKFLTDGIKEKPNKYEENNEAHTPMDTMAANISQKPADIDASKIDRENYLNVTQSIDENDAELDATTKSHTDAEVAVSKPKDKSELNTKESLETRKHTAPLAIIVPSSDSDRPQQPEQISDEQNEIQDLNKDTIFTFHYKQGNLNVPYVNINLLYVWIEQYLTYPTNISESFTIWLDSLSINDMLRILWEGMDVTKPPCKKAKLMRIERKRQKLVAAGIDPETVQQQTQKTKPQNEAKSLEQFLSELPENTKHKLRLVLKRMDTSDETFNVSAQLFAKYQMRIHREPPDECDEETFTEFLVDSPLKAYYSSQGPSHGYGSFHQQYWLDDNLIAVGVIDILPKCISSVYFFYDPDYSFLSLGTYGSLRELQLTRELNKTISDLKYYYMGYYIHSCPKMRYKANLTPSYLLCAETYHWVPIESCLPKLNIDAYVRFNDDSTAIDPNNCPRQDIRKIPIFHNYIVMKYLHFRQRYGTQSDHELYEYANLVGKRCAMRMLLFKE